MLELIRLKAIQPEKTMMPRAIIQMERKGKWWFSADREFSQQPLMRESECRREREYRREGERMSERERE